MRPCCWWLLPAFLACVGLCDPLDAENARIHDVEVGIGDTHRLGFWTGVTLSITAGSEDIRGRLAISTRDGEGIETIFRDDGEPVEVSAGATKQFTRYVKFGRRQQDLLVSVESDGRAILRQVAATKAPLVGEERWVVEVGSDPIGLASALDESTVTHVADPTVLPDLWQGYEGVDLVFLATSDVDRLRSMSDQQVGALTTWLRLGGHLMLSVGSQGANVVGEGGRFASLSPGRFDSVITARTAIALESFVSASQPLDTVLDEQGSPAPMRMTLLDEVRGRVDVIETAGGRERPMVIRTAHGLGQLTFFAFDVDQAPFTNWEAKPRLLRALVDSRAAGSSERRGRDGRGVSAHLGYDDLVGQLRAGLDQFTGVSLVAFSWVAGLIVIYILLIGPGDYFFLRDVIKRFHWTWVSFPLLVLVFSALAVGLHFRMKTGRLRINQVDLVDVDLETATVHGTTWAHIYSPRNQTYDIRHEVNFDDGVGESGGESLLSWQGLPGDGLGGLDSQRPPLFADRYTIGQQSLSTGISGLPISVDATRGLSARWWTTTELKAESELRLDPDGLLRGEISNPLPFKLVNCLILFENWAYRLEGMRDEIAPGASTRMQSARALNLNWRLTRRRVVNIKDVTTPWNQRNLEIPRIMEIMMFYEAAGGEDYTRLRHRYQPYTDVTDHLHTGRAILVGRAPVPASRLVLDNDPQRAKYDQQWTFYRLHFPVQLRKD